MTDGDGSSARPQRTPKSDKALRTIGELAAETGIATHVLRYWERNVSALRPVRLAGGRRYYRAEDAALVRKLHQLVTVDGYTLEGAARAINRGAASEPVQPAADTPAIDRPVHTEPVAAAPFAGAPFPREAIAALRDRLKAALAA